MLTVDKACFDPGGRFVVTITKNRVCGHSIEAAGDELQATPMWEQKLTHASQIVIGGDVVIATSTSGHHLGIDAMSGELLWERLPPNPHGSHEGYAGIVQHVERTAAFVHLAWSGLLSQMDLTTGRDLTSSWSSGVRLAALLTLPDGRLAATATRVAVNDTDRPTQYLTHVDLARRSTRVLTEFGPVWDLRPDPAGERGLVIELYAPPGTEDVPVQERHAHWMHRLRLVELLTGESIALRDVPLGFFNTYSASWSPGGDLIGTVSRSRGPRGPAAHVLLDGRDLSTVTEIAHVDPRGAPAFHPDGNHVLLPGGKKSHLRRLDDVIDAPRD